MTAPAPKSYRDALAEVHGIDIGSVVGCALDRLERQCSGDEIERALAFYRDNKKQLDELAIGERRDQVARHIDPDYDRK